MTSPVCCWNIGNSHPCRLAMVWCCSMYTQICKSRYNVLWWVVEHSANKKAHQRHKMLEIHYILTTQTTLTKLLTWWRVQKRREGLDMTLKLNSPKLLTWWQVQKRREGLDMTLKLNSPK
jgi:hypothetical protein